MNRAVSICRSCAHPQLSPVLDLGATPLANRLLDPAELEDHEPRYPLDVAFCPACTLVQITETVPPEVLFGEYVYFSSFSDTVLAHARDHVEELITTRGLDKDSRIIEIASNDGYLLQYALDAGVPALGVEPARNIARVARERGIPTRNAFFGRDEARRMRADGLTADVILGNNVLAHVADLNGFVAGAAALLREGGIVEFEFPYVGDLVAHLEFDTIYHEHLCYFSAHAIDALFQRHGLVFSDVRKLPIHGGSLRVTGARAATPEGRARVGELLDEELEAGLHTARFYEAFGERVSTLRDRLVHTLEDLRASGKRIVAYGASAKGSTLLNVFGIGPEHIEYVVDRSSAKQGRYTPGTHLEIRPPETLLEDDPDFALLLTWNFADEILEQQAEWRAKGGKFIVPVPDVHFL